MTQEQDPRLGGRADAVGTKLSLNDKEFTVVGVMPASFNYPLETQIWMPLAFTATERHNRESRYLAVLEQACSRITDAVPNYLVVSLGVDTYALDPLGDFALTGQAYPRIGAPLASR